MTSFGYLHGRAPEARDAAFLSRLYASTRTDLLYLPVPREVVDAIIRQQELRQAQGYAQSFPHVRTLVLEHLGAPVGRLVLNEAPGELRVVDISVAPGERRRGHARSVLAALQQRARLEGASVTLRVRRDNPAARALYVSIGFEVSGGDEASEQMRWTPSLDQNE
ncbi:MAG TPA: GNAT family N-acetyltransferase [Telluria sp.]|nr:GNAT family N-acetyltransferase [Telluria sp.]